VDKRYSPEEIKRANIEYHARMANSYNKDQPHYKPENVRRVESIIKDLAAKCSGGVLLDIGCGSGFMLNIAKKYFKRVVGIDITQAMLDKVDLSSGNIELKLADSSSLPFNDKSFDVCTAYGFLHHLPELDSTFKEVSRCLKVGGVFYADQDPNYYCRREIDRLRTEKCSEVLQSEINSIRNVYNELRDKYGLDENTVKLAEFQKLVRGGMKEESVIKSLKRAGFSEVDFDYQWFLGQGYVLHSVSGQAAKNIEEYLKKLLPLSRGLFKYISFIARK
jgi:ubiquinone/menaquinone biosynthesis C-methylase UbiE